MESSAGVKGACAERLARGPFTPSTATIVPSSARALANRDEGAGPQSYNERVRLFFIEQGVDIVHLRRGLKGVYDDPAGLQSINDARRGQSEFSHWQG